MEYLDLCRMREVSKPLKYTPLSVYVRKAFRISTWSLQGSRGSLKCLKFTCIKFKVIKSLKLYKKVLIMISRS